MSFTVSSSKPTFGSDLKLVAHILTTTVSKNKKEHTKDYTELHITSLKLLPFEGVLSE